MNLKNLAMWAIIILLSVGLFNMFQNPEKINASKKENVVEAVLTKIRSKESEIENLRSNLVDANENFNVMQSNFYQVGSDISQHEQTLQHEREKITNTEVELVKARGTYDDIQNQQKLDQTEYEHNDGDHYYHGHPVKNATFNVLAEGCKI